MNGYWILFSAVTLYGVYNITDRICLAFERTCEYLLDEEAE